MRFNGVIAPEPVLPDWAGVSFNDCPCNLKPLSADPHRSAAAALMRSAPSFKWTGLALNFVALTSFACRGESDVVRAPSPTDLVSPYAAEQQTPLPSQERTGLPRDREDDSVIQFGESLRRQGVALTPINLVFGSTRVEFCLDAPRRSYELPDRERIHVYAYPDDGNGKGITATAGAQFPVSLADR